MLLLRHEEPVSTRLDRVSFHPRPQIRRVGVLSHHVFPLNEIVLILWRLLAEKTGEWHGAPIDSASLMASLGDPRGIPTVHGMSGMSFWCGVLYTVQ